MTAGTASRTIITDPDFYGSLTAARDLGRAGHDVAVVEVASRVSRAASSRYCTQRLRAPAAHHSAAMVDWLVRVGMAWPGTLLYPSSDDMAWRIALSQDRLRQHYQLYQPRAQSTLGLLDKSQLYAHAETCGVPYPRTYAPVSIDDVRDLGATLARADALPVIVKPRTQAGGGKSKGLVARTLRQLEESIEKLRHPDCFSSDFMHDAPANIRWPLVQDFMPEAATHTYSLSGFIDGTGTVRAARASTKVFQIPVSVGTGIAFEGRAVRQEQVSAVEAIARSSGYFGAFEAEFIQSVDGRYYLMDFNPRYYGQMNFEVSRGMRLPSIVCAAASGDDVALERLLVESARTLRCEDAASQRFTERWLFKMLLRTQHLGGRLDSHVHEQWLTWMNTGDVFDFVHADDDPNPGTHNRSSHWRHWLRYPRSSYRILFR